MSSNVPVERGSRGEESRRQRYAGSIFGDLMGFDPFRNLFPSFTGASAAGIDVVRTDDGYNVEIPVPGFRPEQIEVTFQDDTLVVSGRSDRRTFTRTLVLPDEIDSDAIAANVDHGMLTLNLRRRPETQPRRIAVQAGSSSASQQPVGGSSAGGQAVGSGATGQAGNGSSQSTPTGP